MDAQARLREGLERLRRDYLAHLPGKAAAISADWTRALSGEREAFDRLATEVHHLCGTGATFGFPEVSAVAGEIEALLIDGPEAARARAAQVGPLVDRLSAIAAAGAPEGEGR